MKIRILVLVLMREHMKTMSPEHMQQCMEMMGTQMQIMREHMDAKR